MIELIAIAGSGFALGVAITAAMASQHIRELRRANRSEIARTDIANRLAFNQAQELAELRKLQVRDAIRKAKCRAAAEKGRAVQYAMRGDQRALDAIAASEALRRGKL